MLGIGAYLTTRYMESGICREAAGYMSSHSFKNFEMISSLGVSEASIEDIKNVEGVTDAEGVMQMTATVSRGYSKRTATILSETTRISFPEVVEGEMPTAENECAMAEDFSEKSGIKVGDTIKVQIKSGDMDYPLHRHKFVVTGLVKHPDYIHRKLTNVVVMPLAAFNEEVTDGYFTRVFVKSEDPSLDEFYSEEYLENSRPLYNDLEKFAEQLEGSRTEEFKKNAHAEIDAEWAKALAEFEKNQGKIDDGKKQLNSKLAEGRKKLNANQTKLNKKAKYYENLIKRAKKKVAEGKKKIRDAKKQIADAKKKIEEAKEQIKKAKEYIELIDKYIPDVKKYIEEMKKDYQEELEKSLKKLAMLEKLIAELDKYAEDSKEYREKAKEIAQFVKENADEVWAIAEKFSSDEVMAEAEKIRDVTEGKIDLTDIVSGLRSFCEKKDELLDLADEIIHDRFDGVVYFVDELRGYIEWLKEELEELKDYEEYLQKYEEYKKEIANKEKEIADKEKLIADKEKQIADGEALVKKWEKKISDGEKKLASEKKRYQGMIDDGWNRYYAAKKKYEAKLAEAIALLAENREKAEKKLEEARAEVDAVDCKWLVLDRTANPGFLDIKSQLQALNKTGTLFGVMFILITAMVCLSTLAIIIEEQKKLIGTVKAFGFHKSEVLGKYLLFGVTAAILGSILAFGIGSVLSQAVLNVYNGQRMYPYEKLTTVIRTGPTIIISLAMIAICALSSIIACSDILRSPASMLMKGETLSKNKAANKKKKESSQKGSLYSKLILRNMKDDKARVIVSTVIVAACCILIGLGVTVKMSFGGTVDKQANEVNNFDLRVDFTKAVTDEDKAAIDKVITDSGADYAEGMYDSRLYRSVDGVGVLNILCAKPDEIKDYIGTYLNGEKIVVPEDGILIPLKMAERNSLSVGDNITAYDSEVEEHEIRVAGTFNNYFARMSIMTPESYKTYFGEDYKSNCRYLHLNGADSKELRKAILAVNSNVSFDTPTSFRPAIEANAKLFNIVTYVTTGIAILMSFMILTNLANIFLTRKKTELSVMRINGFSIKQTKGYLAKESILTTAIGLVAGVLIGSVLTSFAIHMIEPIDFQFDRSFRWTAWAIAAGLEGLFALIIYSSTFRKVKNLNLRDIT